MAMAWRVVASMRATPTPPTSSRMRSAAATTSVIVSGSGPSSRIDPPSTNGTPARTHSNITPPRHEPGLHRGGDRPVPADLVDHPQVVAVAALGRRALGHRDAERRAEHVRLHVVGGEPVAGEQHLDPAAPHQPGDVRPAAGVDDRRPAHRQHRRPGGAGAADALGDLLDEEALRLLRRHLRVHELEGRQAPGRLGRLHPHALVADHHPVAHPDAVHGHGADRCRRPPPPGRSPSPGSPPAPSARRGAPRRAGWWSSRSRRAARPPGRPRPRSASSAPTGFTPCTWSCSARRPIVASSAAVISITARLVSVEVLPMSTSTSR